MRLPFRIFKVQGDGSEHFVEAVQTFDAARARVQTFAALWPGEYVIFDETTGQHAYITAHDQKVKPSADKDPISH